MGDAASAVVTSGSVLVATVDVHPVSASSPVMWSVEFFFFQAEDGIRDLTVTGVQTCALPICAFRTDATSRRWWPDPGSAWEPRPPAAYRSCPSLLLYSLYVISRVRRTSVGY